MNTTTLARSPDSVSADHGSDGALLDQLNWRYATKAFDPARTIAPDDWHQLTEALRLAPSSYGLQPYRALIVESPDIREQLAQAAPLNRAKLVPASRVVVLARLRSVSTDYVDRHVDRIARVRGVDLATLQPYRAMMLDQVAGLSPAEQAGWTARQAYIALGMFLSAAAQLRIDTCAMEGIDPARFDELLGLAGTDYASVVAVAAGYRSPDDATQFAPKVRFVPDEFFATV